MFIFYDFFLFLICWKPYLHKQILKENKIKLFLNKSSKNRIQSYEMDSFYHRFSIGD